MLKEFFENLEDNMFFGFSFNYKDDSKEHTKSSSGSNIGEIIDAQRRMKLILKMR